METQDPRLHQLTRLMYAAMKLRGGSVTLGNADQNFDFDYIADATGDAALMSSTFALGGLSLEDDIDVVGGNPWPADTDRIHDVLRIRTRRGSAITNDATNCTHAFRSGVQVLPHRTARGSGPSE